MLRVRVSDLKPGMYLARPVPVPNRATTYLLQRNVEIKARDILRLTDLGVSEVWVRCDELAFLEDVIDLELQERQRELYSTIRTNFERVMRFADAQLDFNSFQSTVKNLFEYLQNHATGMVFLDKVQIFDDYLMSHSANVCYLAMLLGMKLDWYLVEERRSLESWRAKEVITLGLGCLLHDVGKTRVPKEILDKPSRLTPAEMEEIKRHPAYGYEMVRGKVPPSAAMVVLNHHQRWDGTGYPDQVDPVSGEKQPPLAGKRIHVFGRLATVADVFDATTSKRVYSDAKPSVQALSEMLRYNRGFFDPVVERAFFEVMPAFPIGQIVRLSNGFEAVVVDFNPAAPCQPNVKPFRYPDGEPCRYPDDREIDLSLTSDVQIEAVGDVDVRPYLFSAPFTASAGIPSAAAR
jgi:HD-GYP domain-containing protein (c-di-GMP phosphodiesterase class II)